MGNEEITKSIDQIIKENTLYPDVERENLTSHMVTKFDLPDDDKTPDHTPKSKNRKSCQKTKPNEQNFHHEKYLFNE